MTANELDLIETWVLKIDHYTAFLTIHSWIGIISAACNVGIVWFLFRAHFIKLQSYEFFIEHYDIASTFTRSRYNLHRTSCMLGVPFGVALLIFSLFTKFDTAKFISLLGTNRSFFVFVKHNNFKVKIKP